MAELFPDLALQISQAKTKALGDIAVRSSIEDRIARTEARIVDLQHEADVFEKATMLLNTLGEERQHEAQAMIEGLVTRGLQTVFEPNLSLVISTQVKGKTTTTDFLIRTDLGDEAFETSVMDARGGGLVAVVAFLLRVTVLLLTTEPGRRFLLLDETFAHVSAEYQPAVGAFLRELVDEAGLQIVMVTHSEEFSEHATSVVQFSQVGGRTQVTQA